jgi:hypothetical protein
MGNIIGEGFPKEIIEQINQRQKVYGSINRNNEELAYLNTRTGWCKLVSSVDVDDVSIRNLGLGESKLAEKFVLFNGTTNESPNRGSEETYQRSGINSNNINTNTAAYGLGGTEFGLRPMPGIISAEIKTETRGSIKTATVKVQANNRQQFDIIDLLYMRLGYSVLLEWGNSSFFDNKGNYIEDNPYSLADDFLKGNNNVKYNNILKTISDKRIESCGNYDAMFGKVVNFSWNFTRDGIYDITIKLISTGDVIESLKANLLLPGNDYEQDKNPIGLGVNIYSQPVPTLESQFNNQFTQLLSSNQQLTQFPNLVSTSQPTTENELKTFAYSHEIGKMFNYYINQLSNKENVGSYMSVIKESNTEYSGIKSGDSVSFFKQTYLDGGNQYFVKLAWFLKFIEKKIIPYIDTPEVSYLKIDNNVEDNIIYLLGRQLSTDPRICLFNTTFPTTNGSIQFANQADNFEAFRINNNRYGYIMNAYFNLNFILNQLEALKDKDSRVSIFKLIKCLCDGWNRATGNINKLEPNIDSDTNTIRIIDQVPLPDRDNVITTLNTSLGREISTELAFFDVYRYNNSQAGFVRDINFTTTVAPNLATLITVGATSNGYVIGQDATALSRMNAGLTDRFKKTMKLGNESTTLPSTSSLNQDYNDALNAFNVFLAELGSWKGTEQPRWNIEAITSFNTTAAQFYEYDQAKQTLEAAGLSPASASVAALNNEIINSSKPSSPNCGFLPFDLSLTMDGLSGMKVYQKYIIDTDFLPTNYPESLEFIVKSIKNTIQSNQWTTTLESIAIPKNPFGSTISVVTPQSKTQPNTTSRLYKGSNPTSLTETTDFLISVLKGIGIKNPNQYQIQFMKIWRQHEGGQAAWNPFNTTLKRVGSLPFNRNGNYPVQNYSTKSQGIEATVSTINQPNFKNIKNSIIQIQSPNDINKAMLAVNNSNWGSDFNPVDYKFWVTFNNFIYSSPIIPK